MNSQGRSANGFGTRETSSHNTGGTIDKFIGDAVLAYWTRETPDRPESRERFEQRSEALEERFIRWMLPAEKPFEIAVALHHGVVTCGNMGFVAQRDATIIGDTVNTVFRIESVMKQLDQKLTASQDFLRTLTDPGMQFFDLGEHSSKENTSPCAFMGCAEAGWASQPLSLPRSASHAAQYAPAAHAASVPRPHQAGLALA